MAEQNVNLHDSVHVGDVVQNINAANKCPNCGTANVPVFICSLDGCPNRWCSYCGTNAPGMCLFHQETIRIKQRISSLEGLLAVHEQTRSKLISQVDADADFTSNQARRREAERQQVKAAIENRRDSQLKNLHAEDKLGRLRSIVSGWDLFWAVGTCVLIVDVIAYLAGIEPTNTEELGLYFMLMELPILLMILAWNLNRKLMAIKMEILQLQSMDIAMEVEGVLAENTEREDEQHRREQDQRTRALDECVQRIYDAKVELELLRKQLADLNS